MACSWCYRRVIVVNDSGAVPPRKAGTPTMPVRAAGEIHRTLCAKHFVVCYHDRQEEGGTPLVCGFRLLRHGT